MSETVCHLQERQLLVTPEALDQLPVPVLTEADSYAGRERAQALVAAEVGRSSVATLMPFGHGLMAEYPVALPQAGKNDTPPPPKPTSKATGHMVDKRWVITDSEVVD